jgi:hypothetical protein
MARSVRSNSVPKSVPACCGNCDCFSAPKAVPQGMPEATAIRQSSAFVFGRCRRFPLTVEKKPDEWCREHQAAGKPEAV